MQAIINLRTTPKFFEAYQIQQMVRLFVDAPTSDTASRPVAAVRDGGRALSAAERYRDQLLEDVATPQILVVLKRKFGAIGADIAAVQAAIDDAYAETIQKLSVELDKARAAQDAGKIKNFLGLASLLAYQAFGDYLAQEYPQRNRLRNRLYYLLNRAPFALWLDTASHLRTGGLEAWRRSAARRSPALDRLDTDPLAVYRTNLRASTPDETQTGLLVRAIYQWVGHAFLVEILVSAVGQIQGIVDQREASLNAASDLDNDGPASIREPVDPRATPEQETQARQLLLDLWRRIGELPQDERFVLLLPHAEELCLFGVARLDEIAQALGMEWDEFTPLWRRLPVPDNEIARMLQITPDRVAYLRLKARRKLAKIYEEGTLAQGGSGGSRRPAVVKKSTEVSVAPSRIANVGKWCAP